MSTMAKPRHLVAVDDDTLGDDEPTAVEQTGFEDTPPVMSPMVLAQLLEVSTKSLERWRESKTGPAWIKLPGSSLIRYTRADVLAWLRAHRQEAGA